MYMFNPLDVNREKVILRQKALDVAGYQHREDAEIKAIDAKINDLNVSIRATQNSIVEIQKQLMAENANKNKILMPYIPEELRE